MTLEEQVILLRSAYTKFSDRWYEAKKKLIEDGSCTHSDTMKYTWEFDNGYGKQTKHAGTVCLICGFKDPYNDGKFREPY